jgi:lactate racemase
MRIPFSYSDVPPIEIPDANFAGVLTPREVEAPRPLHELVEEALDHPIASEPLEQLVSPSTRVLILTDDITRQTPAAQILPVILRRMCSADVGQNRVKILIAAGTHAHMTQAETRKKLGAEIARNTSVTLHHWKEQERLREIGAMPDGTPIRVNRMLGEADLVIGIGQIVPHRVMGFTGGSSIVQPGVSGPEITGHTHWLSALYPGTAIMGRVNNPVRKEVEEIARMAGLRFIVNVVMDGKGRVIHVVAGHPVDAHHRGAELSREIYAAPQAEVADVVVAESYPADYDLWQAAKGVYGAELAVRQGGAVILVTPCRHGVSNEHPEVEQIGYRHVSEVQKMVDKKKITDLVAAAHLAHVGRVIRDVARGIMVSDHIPPEVQKRVGFKPAPTPDEALKMAFAIAGKRQARVVVLRHGGDVLPRRAKA